MKISRGHAVMGQDYRRAAGRGHRLACGSIMRTFSGIQPTGSKHLGNYSGAISRYVEAQDRGEALFCIVDLHATTVAYDPAELRRSLYDLAALLLAAGLDPERCVLFRQSDVPEHTELTWLLTSVTAYGDLQRMHQFKEKSAAQRELVSAGLFLYPVLMAADVLAYRAREVPVGDDQRQHVELMRDIAIRFNARYGGGEPVLVVPEHRIPSVGARIMDLQEPTRKMSTTGGSEQGTVYVLDEPRAVERKIRSAVTDSGAEIRRAPDKPGVSNLIEVLAVARGATPEAVEADLAGARGYGDLKAAVAAAVVAYLAPVRERYAALRADEGALEAVLAQGAARAQAMAAGGGGGAAPPPVIPGERYGEEMSTWIGPQVRAGRTPSVPTGRARPEARA
jgi:tryptophanyl-tRNA synthetase